MSTSQSLCGVSACASGYIFVTCYEKKGHSAKIPDRPFLLPFASTEFCAHSHIFVLFVRQSTETHWLLIFRHPGNLEFKKNESTKV